MKVVVSSPWTLAFKWIFPAVWGGVWSYATASLFLGKTTSTFSVRVGPWYIIRDQPDAWGKWVFLAFLVLGGFIFRTICYPLKRVALEDDRLLISNYRREISVPFTSVNAGGFSGGQINGSPVVELVFKADTAFGRSILFVPASREALSLLRARLRPELGAEVDPEAEAIADELRGRGTV